MKADCPSIVGDIPQLPSLRSDLEICQRPNGLGARSVHHRPNRGALVVGWRQDPRWAAASVYGIRAHLPRIDPRLAVLPNAYLQRSSFCRKFRAMSGRKDQTSSESAKAEFVPVIFRPQLVRHGPDRTLSKVQLHRADVTQAQIASLRIPGNTARARH